MEELKKCTKCGRLLPLTEFYRTKNSKSGRRAECRSCAMSYNKKRRERLKEKKPRIRIERKPQPKPEKIEEPDNTRCKTCIYRTSMYRTSQDVMCYYIVITGQKRGCEGGAKCTKYKKGRPAKIPPTIKGRYTFRDKRDRYET